MKSTFIACLTIVNFVGVFGLYKAIMRIDVRKEVALVVSLSLLFQYYTITDWFIRGAFAEYTAMMLIPWFFYWAFGLLVHRKYSYSIGLIFGFTYLAHSIIAYYLIFAIVFAQLLDLYINKPKIRVVLVLYLKAACVAIPMIVLFNFPILITSKYYDPSYIKLDMTNHFLEIIWYFYNPAYTWNKTWEGYTVELNPVMVVFIVMMCLATIFLAKQKSTSRKPIFIYISFLFLFYALLQLRSSHIFYETIPGADFIQFPWRLLSFIQICALLLLAMLFNSCYDVRSLKRAGLVYLIVIAFFYPLFKPTAESWQWFEAEYVNRKVNEAVYGIGEYNPIVKGYNKPSVEYFDSISARGIETMSRFSTVKPYANNTMPEQLELRYKINTLQSDTVILPLSFSGLELAYKTKDNERIFLRSYRLDSDPRIRIALPKGNYDLLVYLPSMRNFFK